MDKQYRTDGEKSGGNDQNCQRALEDRKRRLQQPEERNL